MLKYISRYITQELFSRGITVNQLSSAVRELRQKRPTMKTTSKPLFWYALFLSTFVLMFMLTVPNSPPRMYMVNKLPKVMHGKNGEEVPYDKNTPVIFVGGMPRSGTTLMRVMLDAHPDVRCGEETHVVPMLLGMRTNLGAKEFSRTRLTEAGITGEILDDATRAFILEIIAHHGEPAKYLCNKDPFTQKSSVYLKRIFPNAKFLFMVRDGRATVHSFITRNVSIGGFNLKSYKQSLGMWSKVMTAMYSECLQVGSESCMPVYYEQLVLQPEVWMKRVVNFLGISWNESVLHHEDYIGKEGGISMTNSEPSSDQVIKPVNVASLYSWVGQIPQDVIDDMPIIAPMLRALGYDPLANPPDYGEPDARVADNTVHIEQDADYWRQRAEEIEADNPLKNLTLKYQQQMKENMEKMKKEKEKNKNKTQKARHLSNE